MSNLPPYLFARIDEMKAEQQKKGVDIIDLGVGDPDLPTPPHIVAALCTAAQDPANHHYPSYAGIASLPGSSRRLVPEAFRRHARCIKGDPRPDGVKGRDHPYRGGVCKPRRLRARPEPWLSRVSTGTLFAEGKVHEMPLLRENNFLPVLGAIPEKVARSAKLMFINYPNNPTAAVAPPSFYREVVDFAADHHIVVVSDNPYSEVAFDGYRAPSFLEAKGAMEVGVEMHSLSKTYNMTGWRIGMAVGNQEILAGLARVKTNVDSGVFNAVQYAAIAALSGPQDCVKDACAIYQERRDVLIAGLRELGFDVPAPRATFYVWMPVNDCMSFAAKLLNEAGIVVTPGIGFGSAGEGYVRFAITRPVERIREAIGRMRRLSL